MNWIAGNRMKRLDSLPSLVLDSMEGPLGRAVIKAGYELTPRNLMQYWNCGGIDVQEFLSRLERVSQPPSEC